MLDAIEKLRQRRIISDSEAGQLTSSLFNSCDRSSGDEQLNRLFIKVSEWVEATKFDQSRLDQVLAGRLLVRLNTNRRSLEFYAPESAEEDSSDR